MIPPEWLSCKFILVRVYCFALFTFVPPFDIINENVPTEVKYMLTDVLMRAMHKRNATAVKESVSKTKMMLDGSVSLDSLDQILKNAKPALPLKSHLLKLMGEKEMSNEDLGILANIGRSTVYKIMDGKQRPEQDVLLRMAFALELSGEETQQLLKAGHRALLTASRPRDIAIIFGLQNGLTLDEMDGILMERGMEPLTPPVKKLSEALAPLMKNTTVNDLVVHAHLNSETVKQAVDKAKPDGCLEVFDLLADSLEKDDLLRIGFVLHATQTEMQHILRIAHRAFLNTKDIRDQQILLGLAAEMSLEEINAVLAESNLKRL